MNQVPVIVFGVGGIGRTLLRQIVESRDVVSRRNQVQFNVVAAIDSRSWLWQPEGLDDDQLGQIIAQKQAGNPLSGERPANEAILPTLHSAGVAQAILVDVTAAEGMEALIDQALSLDYSVVLANKKPLAGPWPTAKRFFEQPRVRYESTVGGGQPVIATLQYLRDTNDVILAIEGQMSGTLGYICSRLDDRTPFSVAVAEAKMKGFTEPDPRDDLGGLDVMRKILILARLAGWPLEESDIEVEALYPPELAHLSVMEFMRATVALDPSISDRVTAAGQAGQVLRYVAQVTETGGSVGLKGQPQGSPLANLKYISFRTGRYEDEPLMIGGKGAGLEMTAAGVLGDMIALARMA